MRWTLPCAVILVACHGSSASSPEADSSVDDATDTMMATDSGGMEEVAIDTRVDTGPTPLGGDWQPFPDTACPQELAKDPATSIPTLTWYPCSTGPAGCEDLFTDWTTTDPSPLQLYNDEPVRWVDGRALIQYTRHYPDKVDVEVVQPLDGPGLFAMRGPHNGGKCPMNVIVGDFGIATYPRLVTGALTGLPIPIGTMPWGGSLTVTAFDAALLGTPQYMFSAAVAKNLVFLEREVFKGDYGSAKIQWLDPVTKTLSSPDSAVTGSYTSAFGTGVLTRCGGEGPCYLDDKGHIEQLVPPVANHAASGVTIDPSGAGRLVWIDGEAPPAGGAFSNFTLWVSPFSPTASGIVARKLTKLPTGTVGWKLAANGGFAVVQGGTESSVFVVNLDDGSNWTIDLGRSIALPLWIDERYVWIVLSTEDVRSRATGTLVRIARDKLGPATPAN